MRVGEGARCRRQRLRRWLDYIYLKRHGMCVRFAWCSLMFDVSFVWLIRAFVCDWTIMLSCGEMPQVKRTCCANVWWILCSQRVEFERVAIDFDSCGYAVDAFMIFPIWLFSAIHEINFQTVLKHFNDFRSVAKTSFRIFDLVLIKHSWGQHIALRNIHLINNISDHLGHPAIRPSVTLNGATRQEERVH